MASASPDALERARRVKLMIFDVDGVLTDGGISFGNAVLPIGPDKPVFADLVMGGLAPLRQLRAAGVVEPTARIFAHARGMAMLVPAFFMILGVQWMLDRLFVEQATTSPKAKVRRRVRRKAAGAQTTAQASSQTGPRLQEGVQ